MGGGTGISGMSLGSRNFISLLSMSPSASDGIKNDATKIPQSKVSNTDFCALPSVIFSAAKPHLDVPVEVRIEGDRISGL